MTNFRFLPIVFLTMSLSIAQAAPAGQKPWTPPAACDLLPGKIAEVYADVQPTPILTGSKVCGYSSAPGRPLAQVSIALNGPLPTELAKSTYDASFAQARKQNLAEGLHGFGPEEAFGIEASDGKDATASVTFLSGQWIVQIAISAPAGTGDATVDNLASLLKNHIWKRWK